MDQKPVSRSDGRASFADALPLQTHTNVPPTLIQLQSLSTADCTGRTKRKLVWDTTSAWPNNQLSRFPGLLLSTDQAVPTTPVGLSDMAGDALQILLKPGFL